MIIIICFAIYGKTDGRNIMAFKKVYDKRHSFGEKE